MGGEHTCKVYKLLLLWITEFEANLIYRTSALHRDHLKKQNL